MNQIVKGNIVIDPFDFSRIGPNSIDLHLGNFPLLCYSNDTLDAASLNETAEIPPTRTPEGAYWYLEPGHVYLGCTAEYTETHGFVPYLDGRSSLGRLGVFAHVTAGRGDLGFKGRWTVEIVVTHRTKLYVGGRYFQLTYHTIEGKPLNYSGQYQADREPQAPKKPLF